MTRTRGAWRPQPDRADPRNRAAQKAALEDCRTQVRNGARCHFHHRKGYERCPGTIDLRLPANHRWALTAHHLHRIMDGGPAVTPRYAPAHRSCNSADGLRAQNARRAGQRTHSSTPTQPAQQPEHRSRAW